MCDVCFIQVTDVVTSYSVFPVCRLGPVRVRAMLMSGPVLTNTSVLPQRTWKYGFEIIQKKVYDVEMFRNVEFTLNLYLVHHILTYYCQRILLNM